MIGQAEPGMILLVATGYNLVKQFSLKRIVTKKLDKVKNPYAEYFLEKKKEVKSA